MSFPFVGKPFIPGSADYSVKTKILVNTMSKLPPWAVRQIMDIDSLEKLKEIDSKSEDQHQSEGKHLLEWLKKKGFVKDERH